MVCADDAFEWRGFEDRRRECDGGFAEKCVGDKGESGFLSSKNELRGRSR